MSGAETTMTSQIAAPPRNRWLRLSLRLANMIRIGTLTVILPDGSTHVVRRSEEPHATIILKEPRAARRLLLGGSLGLAEAYIDGDWDSPDIRGVMAVASANEAEWVATLDGTPWTRFISRVLHRLRPNTRGGARKNITDHYDLGNDFYAAWLDPTMTYSSAIFADGQANDDTLEAAQLRKIHRLCRALDLKPGMTLLEIGCGWGSFAEVAARDYGAIVTGITLSPAQLAAAQARIARAGLCEQVAFKLEDYRDTKGSYDRIASIEMFEAVGEKWWPTYFDTLRARLIPGGVAGLQVITIADRLWEPYRGTADFIQRHIFPGGMLPCPARLEAEVARAGLHWKGKFWFGQDYAETLARWNAAFQHAWPQIAGTTGGAGGAAGKQPKDLRFKRLWEYYLAYCETGFRAGWTDVGQILLARPA
jgi:cyclopropane-fatty-acyl-phospholipid synthase